MSLNVKVREQLEHKLACMLLSWGVFGWRDEVGWNGTVLGRLMFGWESPESEDVPLGNIRMRFGFTPSPQISRTGAVPSGTRRSLAGVE